MPLFTTATLERFLQEGESTFAVERPCILTRLALTVSSGTALYTLPDDVVSIRRVAWKGSKLDPLTHRSQREVFQSATQSGKPFWYVFNNIGQNKIKFFPSPNESVASTAADLYGAEIRNRVIVEYWRTPDYVNFVVPEYFRRRLLKAFVGKMCFAIEGAGQNLSNSTYFDKKYAQLQTLYANLLDDIHEKPRKLVLGNVTGSNYFPGSPILPIARYGVAVDTGE